MSIQFSSEHQ